MSHEVFFILDHRFSEDLWSLSRSAHAWLIKSPQNDVTARVVWDRESESYSPDELGVEVFLLKSEGSGFTIRRAAAN